MLRDQESYRVVASRVQEACVARGLDLVQPLQVGWYNDVVDAAYRLPDFGRPAGLALVIGNTRALWPRLRDALAIDPLLAGDANPVDRYCETAVRAALAGVAQAWELRFAPEPPPRRVAMQRLAHVAGLAHLSPSYLSVHPIYGPWIALRAAVVIDMPGPPGPPPVLAAPCDCSAHCMPHLQTALDMAREGVPDAATVERRWQAWVAVRDACPVGRAYRYEEDQIRYHYTKDRRALRCGA